MGAVQRLTVILATIAAATLLGVGLASACNLGGWLTVTGGPQEGQLTVEGGGFPAGDVLIRSGNTSGPVIAEAVAGENGRFEALVAVPDAAASDTKILAEPVVQPDAGSRVHAWTFIGAEALEPPAGFGDAPSLLAVGLTALALLLAAGLWPRSRRSGDAEHGGPEADDVGAGAALGEPAEHHGERRDEAEEPVGA